LNSGFDHDLNLAFGWEIVKRIIINAKRQIQFANGESSNEFCFT